MTLRFGIRRAHLEAKAKEYAKEHASEVREKMGLPIAYEGLVRMTIENLVIDGGNIILTYDSEQNRRKYDAERSKAYYEAHKHKTIPETVAKNRERYRNDERYREHVKRKARERYYMKKVKLQLEKERQNETD